MYFTTNRNFMRIIVLGLTLGAFTVASAGTARATDAAQVAGDLQVDGLWFSGDSNKTVIRKPSDFPAPWTITDADIYFTRGNVGIGTLTPTTLLDVNGTVKATQFTGDGSALSGVWKQAGNVGTAAGTDFIGTTDNIPLEIRVFNTKALRIEPTRSYNYYHPVGAPNIIAGFYLNSSGPGVEGATISGGGAVFDNTFDPSETYPNTVTGDFGTISGGFDNQAGSEGFVGGGWGNKSTGMSSSIPGGRYNSASGFHSSVGGGFSNNASGMGSFVAGGGYNTASGVHSFAAGYFANTQTADTVPVVHDGVFIFADNHSLDFNSVTSNEFAVRATGGVRFVTAINGTTGAPTKTTTIDENGTLTTSNVTALSGPVTSGCFYCGTAPVNGMMVSGSNNDRYVAMKRDGAGSNVLSVSKGDAGYMAGFYVNGAHVGEISSTTFSTSYGTTSDLRLKQNIRPTAFSMDDLMQLQVRDYTYIADAANTPQTGFIAQELHELIPQAVTVGGADPSSNPWQVDYGKLTPFLVKAVQDLKAQKDAEIAALTVENSSLKARLERLEGRLGISE